MNKITHNWAEHIVFAAENTHFPLTLAEVSRSQVSATLGLQALDMGLMACHACLAGGVVVVVWFCRGLHRRGRSCLVGPQVLTRS